MLPDDGTRDPDSGWRRRCASCRSSSCPSEVVVPGLLDGLDNVNRLADQRLARGRRIALRVGLAPHALAARRAAAARLSPPLARTIAWHDGAADASLVVLKGYPRLSETFIAQEIRALEQRGLALAHLVAAPPDRQGSASGASARSRRRSPICRNISIRSRCACCAAWRQARRWPRLSRGARGPGSRSAGAIRTPNRGRRFGQACVLAAELPADVRPSARAFPAHAGLGRRATPRCMTGLPWSCSAHAKDIWTTPDWEKREKLARCRLGGDLHRAAAASICRRWRRPADKRRPGLSRPRSSRALPPRRTRRARGRRRLRRRR